MYDKVVRYMKKYHMIEDGERVVVGVSGGGDSMCLFYILLRYMKEQYGENYAQYLTGVHIHHGVRGAEADGDEQFVREVLEREQVPCVVERYDVPAYSRRHGLTLEEAGRKLRYETFYRIAEGGKIAVAHHSNDNAETILHNLCRGTGLKGLGGMAPIQNQVIRPLLRVSRKEVQAYLESFGIDYCTDSTNSCCDYTRNRLRLDILQTLEAKVNPQVIRHIENAGADVREAEEFIQSITEQHYQALVVEEEQQSCALGEDLLKLDVYLGKRVIRMMVEKQVGGLKDISRVHIDTLYQLLEKDGGKRVDLPGDLEGCMQYGKFIIRRKQRRTPKQQDWQEEEQEILIEVPGRYSFGTPEWRFEFKEYIVKNERENAKYLKKIIKNKENTYTKYFDYDKMEFNLRLRYRQPGDFLTVNRQLEHKTLKRYFIDEKIPKEERGRIPLLADGNHVLWVVGHRMSEAYKVTEYTRRILAVCVTIERMEEDEGKNQSTD